MAVPQMGGNTGIQMTGRWHGAPQQQATGGEVVGTVKSYSEKNGYGFISVPGMQSDARFQTRDVDPSEIPSIAQGAQVQFDTFTTPDGRVQARSVRIATGMAPQWQAPASQ